MLQKEKNRVLNHKVKNLLACLPLGANVKTDTKETSAPPAPKQTAWPSLQSLAELVS